MMPYEKVWTITLSERGFDTAGTLRLQEEVWKAFTEGATTLHLDFSEVPSIDALAVACLVQLIRQAPLEMHIVLVGLNRDALAVARATRLGEIVDIQERAEAPLQRLAG